tara:strand:- start:4 stop:810 length:807 start_codon:yes stop_codon:yes gene_type:complete
MFSDFKIRSITAAGLAFLSFLVLYLGHFYLKIFIYFLSAILFFEWMRIISQTQWIVRGLVAVVFSSFIYFTDGYSALDILFIVSGSIIISSFSAYFSISAFWSCFGFIYILTSLCFLEYLRNFENGLLTILFIISTIMISDISGYVFGKYFSGPKIFKKISPKKTYSGFIASITLGTLWFSMLSLIYSLHQPITFILIGLFIVVFSITGDLLISYLKRKTNLKDSGIILPGHGGLFDRADSIISVFFILLPLAILMGQLDNPIKIILG